MATDFLVIGSGLAGLNAALRLASHGTVTLVTKQELADTATAWAQGGIASVTSEDDSFEQHVKDTLEAGAGLCDRKVTESIVEEGPRAVERMIALGVSFDQHEGTYDLHREGGHQKRRILHSQDFTGREVMRALREEVRANSKISILHHALAVDLIMKRKYTSDEACLGAYVFDVHTQSVRTVRARATLLATGGLGKAFLYTSNPDVATGDGVAMAFRAGATLRNLEFVQFHPTCLFHPRAKSFLISEALRGEGGVLRTPDGQAIMEGIHALGDLAPRDIVARRIDEVMKRSGEDCVFLDMTHLEPAFVAERFPNIHAACISFGIDMTRNPIPVVPAAHYACGGIKTDLNGATDMPGLWAAGECASTGFHGANRLASNSLLEAAVVSDRAATDMIGYAKSHDHEVTVTDWDEGNAVHPDEMVVVSHNWDELRRTMWSYASIVRSDKRLIRAQHRVSLLREEIREFYWNYKLTADFVEVRNIATVAELIVQAALARRESRGLHYNIDTPDLAPHPTDTLIHKAPKGAIEVMHVPVAHPV